MCQRFKRQSTGTFPKSFWSKDLQRFQESAFSVRAKRASNKERNELTWFHKPAALGWFLLATSRHLLLTSVWKLAGRPQGSSITGPPTSPQDIPAEGMWWGVSSTRAPVPQVIVLPAPGFGMLAALKDTVSLSLRCWVCNIIFGVHPSAIHWASTMCPVQSTMKDLRMVSSEKGLILPRPTHFK